MGSLVKAFVGTKGNPGIDATQFNTLPDFGKSLLEKQILPMAQTLSGNASNYAPVSFSPIQQDILNQQIAGLPTNLNYGRPDFKFGQQANNAFGQAGNAYKAAGNAFGQASGYLQGALPYIQQSADYTARGVDPITGQEINTATADFMNPYENQVIGNTIRDIEKYGQGLFSNARSLVSDAGGSGSNRANLLAADIAREQMQRVGDVSSQLRSQGFESATSKALNRLQQGRANYLSGAGLALNQAGSMQNQATGAMNIGSGFLSQGSGLSGLGSNYLQGRGMMEDIAQNNRTNAVSDRQFAIEDLARRFGAGEILRGQQQQQQAVPFQQLQTLIDVFGLIPQGLNSGRIGATDGTAGILGSGGSKTQAAISLAKLAGGFM